MIGRSVVILLVTSYCSHVSAARWAEEMFVARSHDFGTVARDAKAEYEFVFENRYLEDVRVASARVSCSCTSVTVKNPELKTWEKGAIVAELNTKAFDGPRHVTITVTFDKPYRATVQLQVKGHIRRDVLLEPGGVALGEIDRGTASEKTIRVSRSGRSDWRVLDVKSSNPHLSGEVLQVVRGGNQVICDVRVVLAATAPVGYIRDHVMLVTNDRTGNRIPVPVDGRVCPSLVASPSSMFLGAVTPGQSVTRPLVVRSRRPFRVLAVASEHDSVAADLSDSGSAAKPIHVIPVTFTASDQPGTVVEVIRIETDQEGETTEITAHAVVRP